VYVYLETHQQTLVFALTKIRVQNHS